MRPTVEISSLMLYLHEVRALLKSLGLIIKSGEPPSFKEKQRALTQCLKPSSPMVYIGQPLPPSFLTGSLLIFLVHFCFLILFIHSFIHLKSQSLPSSQFPPHRVLWESGAPPGYPLHPEASSPYRVRCIIPHEARFHTQAIILGAALTPHVPVVGGPT